MDEEVGTGVHPSERAHHAGAGGSTPERRRRMSARRKQDAVLRLLRGEDLELLSRQLGGDRRRFEQLAGRLPGSWRGVVEDPAYQRSGRRDRPSQGEGGRSDDGQRVARGQDRAAGVQPPFGTKEVEAMSRRVSPSTDQVYGLQRVTRIWGVSRATVYRHRHRSEAIERRRPGPLGAMTDEELVRAIRRLLQDSPFHGEGYRKLWARLRFAGIRTSRRRVLRLIREHGLLAHQRVGRPRGSRAHDGTITTERVDLMWGTDLTTVVTGEGQAAVFIAVDHCSAECIGLHASRSADRLEALEPIRQGVRERFGAFGNNAANGLALRHDHGSQYLSHHFQSEIRFLGLASSPAFVREPEGNGCAERFIRTLKENLLWVRHFATVEELRLALIAFKRTYNQTWIIERHGYKTPAQVRAGQIAAMSMAA